MKVHVLGRLHCPECRCKQPFAGHDDPDPSAARCMECGYQFGYCAGPDGSLTSTLSVEVVTKARAEYAEERARDALRRGISDQTERARAMLELPPEARLQARSAGAGPVAQPSWSPEQLAAWERYQCSRG